MAAGNVNPGSDYPNLGYDGLPKQMARARQSRGADRQWRESPFEPVRSRLRRSPGDNSSRLKVGETRSMVGKQRPLNDRTRLSKDANAALDAVLGPGEEVQVIIPGTFGSALVGTGSRGFVWKKGQLSVHPYESLAMVAFGDGLTKWVQFRGHSAGRKEPTYATLPRQLDAIQLHGYLDKEARTALTLLVASGATATPVISPGVAVSGGEPVSDDAKPGDAALSAIGGPSDGGALVFSADEQLAASVPLQSGRVAHLTNQRLIVTGPDGGAWGLGLVARVVDKAGGMHELAFEVYDDERREGKPRRLSFPAVGVMGSEAVRVFARQVARAAAERLVGPEYRLQASLVMKSGRVALLTSEWLLVTGTDGGSWRLGAIDRVTYSRAGFWGLTFDAYDDERRQGKSRRLHFGLLGSPEEEAFVWQVAAAAAGQASGSVPANSSSNMIAALPPAVESVALGPDELLRLLCTECWTPATGRAADTALSCSTCLVVYRFVGCGHCSSIDQIKAETQRSWTCGFCGGANDILAGDQSSWLTIGQRQQELLSRGLLTEAPDVRLVGAFTVVGGSGFDMAPASICSVMTTPSVVRIAVELGIRGVPTEIPYVEITTLTVDGGAVTTGPSFIGGGFGITGAAKGMIYASVLNAAFQRTMMTTLLRVTSSHGEVWLHHGSLTSQAVRLRLSPMWVRYEAAQRVGSIAPAQSPNDPVQLLTRLGELRDAGVLTNEEFLAKKAELLSRM